MVALPFDLSTLIKKVTADHADEPSPQRISALVMEQIPPEHHAELVARLLPQYVGQILRRAENVPATSPRIEWEDTLGERMPTADGYRFLRDCTAEDVRAGAQRRRVNAEALNRRAELYEAIAERLDAGVEHIPQVPQVPAQAPAPTPAPTAATLSPLVGAEIIIRQRGYRLPWGAGSIDELPPGMRPTINEILDELAYIPLDTLVSQLRDRPDLLDKVAVGSARGWTSAELEQALESPELIEPFHQALLRTHANLSASASIKRLENDRWGRRRLGEDARAVRDRITQVGRIIERRALAILNPGATRTPEEKQWRAWSRDLSREHRELYHAELDRRLDEAGLPRFPPVDMPSRFDFFQFALEHGLAEPDPAAAAVHAYTDGAFDLLVRDDITTRADPRDAAALRHPMNQARWRAALKAISREHLQREVEEGPARVRASRFHQALMQRQGEANRVDADLGARIRAYVSETNHTDERLRIIDETVLWLAQEVGEESPLPYDPRWLTPGSEEIAAWSG